MNTGIYVYDVHYSRLYSIYSSVSISYKWRQHLEISWVYVLMVPTRMMMGGNGSSITILLITTTDPVPPIQLFKADSSLPARSTTPAGMGYEFRRRPGKAAQCGRKASFFFSKIFQAYLGVISFHFTWLQTGQELPSLQQPCRQDESFVPCPCSDVASAPQSVWVWRPWALAETTEISGVFAPSLRISIIYIRKSRVAHCNEEVIFLLKDASCTGFAGELANSK